MLNSQKKNSFKLDFLSLQIKQILAVLRCLPLTPFQVFTLMCNSGVECNLNLKMCNSKFEIV